MIPPLPPRPRSPWQRVYGSAHRWRARWWRSRSAELPRPVISVGALHWGGVGKTPLTIAIARHLREAGEEVAILSRGYRRTSRGPRIVGRGDGPTTSPEEAGDEPYLMATALTGVPVVVAARRADGGRLAMESLEPPPDLFLLDDGFSHLQLERDVDLVVLPRSDPFGGGRLLPGGRLREPLESLRRADAVLVAGMTADPGSAASIARTLRDRGFHGPGFACVHDVGPARRLDDDASENESDLRLDASERCLLVTGVARPERVRRGAERHGLDIRHHLELPDHHPYPGRTLDEIDRLAERHRVDVILTTAKDAVKLRRHENRFVPDLAVLSVTARPEPEFWQWLDERLAEIRSAERDPLRHRTRRDDRC